MKKRICNSRWVIRGPILGESSYRIKTWRDGTKSCAVKLEYRGTASPITTNRRNQQITTLDRRWITNLARVLGDDEASFLGAKAIAQLIRRCGSFQALYAEVHGGAPGGGPCRSKYRTAAECSIQMQLKSPVPRARSSP
jgi:hypothetical protein